MSLVILACIYVIPLCADTDTDDRAVSNVAVNFLESVGNDFAPDACGQVHHTFAGEALVFVLVGRDLVPEKEYVLRYADDVLAKGISDSEGKLYIETAVTDPVLLQHISDNIKRKFDLWQSSHRLARSADFFDFEYIPET